MTQAGTEHAAEAHRPRIFVTGCGAVSPAGWGVPALRDALSHGQPLPDQPLARPSPGRPLRARLVPPPNPRPAFLAHPRLRRTTPITHYAAAAALEAAAPLAPKSASLRLGIIVCLQSGCVQFSCRFFDETLKDPATASPLVFPETVYAAPASHIAALFESVVLACTLVGDPACFLQGAALGAQWLRENSVDACLLVGAEETNWIVADALWRLDRPAVIAGGAGALCLTRAASPRPLAELLCITDAYTYTAGRNRSEAARAMRAQLPGDPALELLCDGLSAGGRADAAEASAWNDWSGARLSPKRVLGEGLIASAAWQCVAACDALAGGHFAAADISLVGSNQQAIGARFGKIK